MNPDVKTKWVAALRSGEYKQGTEHLHSGDSFCCLGVLCDLYAKEHPANGKWELVRNDVFEFRNAAGVGAVQILPRDVVKWAKLPDSNPMIRRLSPPRIFHCIADLNDDGMSFSDIADLIEKQL